MMFDNLRKKIGFLISRIETPQKNEKTNDSSVKPDSTNEPVPTLSKSLGENLKNIRDTLLPKLLSGEVEIPDFINEGE